MTAERPAVPPVAAGGAGTEASGAPGVSGTAPVAATAPAANRYC